VQSRLSRVLAEAVDQGVWRVQIDTYEREVERYGGEAGVELAEQIFHADSEAVVELLNEPDDSSEPPSRFLLTVLGVDALLGDFGLVPDERRRYVTALRDRLATLVRVEGKPGHLLGAAFRQHAPKGLSSLVDGSTTGPSPSALRAAGPLQKRSGSVAAAVAALNDLERRGALTTPVAALIDSFVHMHVNRLLRSARVEDEWIVADFLRRLYEERMAKRPA
jgi:thiopeptide-type bacteriocin biosynthesis protein